MYIYNISDNIVKSCTYLHHFHGYCFSSLMFVITLFS